VLIIIFAATAKRALGILFPQQHKCADVACNPLTAPKFKMARTKSTEKQADLKRHRDILIATIEYILQQLTTEGLSKNDFDNVAGYYHQQKYQVDKYFQLGRLDILQTKFSNLTRFPIHKIDLSFNEYIKKETGYIIDIFETLETRVNEIIAQNRITNEKEIGDIMIMMDVYKHKLVDVKKSEILKNLLIDYYNQRRSK
jgi:hypothetical protein